MKEDKKKTVKKSAVGVVIALLLVVASAGYIIIKVFSNKAYNEKWKDYDECGLV